MLESASRIYGVAESKGKTHHPWSSDCLLRQCRMEQEQLEHAEDLRVYPQPAFHVVLEQHRTPVIRFLYRLVNDRVLAEELAQEVFLRAYRSPAPGTLPSKVLTLLFQSATELARNRLRDTGTVSPEIPVCGAMAALPASQRAAVLMHKYEGFDYAQIGHVLNCSDAAVKLLLLQAYRILHVQMMKDATLTRPLPWPPVVRSLPT